MDNLPHKEAPRQQSSPLNYASTKRDRTPRGWWFACGIGAAVALIEMIVGCVFYPLLLLAETKSYLERLETVLHILFPILFPLPFLAYTLDLLPTHGRSEARVLYELTFLNALAYGFVVAWAIRAWPRPR